VVRENDSERETEKAAAKMREVVRIFKGVWRWAEGRKGGSIKISFLWGKCFVKK